MIYTWADEFFILTGLYVLFEMNQPISGLQIVDIDPDDLDDILRIEEESFITPWPREIFEMEFRVKRSYNRVCKDFEGKLLGYCLSWLVYDEVHILKVAVHPGYRKRGIAMNLIRDTFLYFESKGAKNAILEVRTDNSSAISLYEKLGFRPVRIRRNYYQETGDDALVMMAEL